MNMDFFHSSLLSIRTIFLHSNLWPLRFLYLTYPIFFRSVFCFCHFLEVFVEKNCVTYIH